MRAWRWVGLGVLALLLVALPAQAQEKSVAGWIQQLREGDAAERIEALEELSLLGELARPSLEAALTDLDPDIRFHALYLLRAPEGALERNLRRIAFGRANQPGATYDLSLKAYRSVIRRATPGVRSQILRISLRAAPHGKPQARLVIVALSVWSELARGKEVSSGEAQLLAELLGLDLGLAGDDLLEAFATLPTDKRLAALRGALSSKNSLQLARAARALGETTERGQVVEANRLLLPLLDHGEARVRLQAVYALGLLGRGDEKTRLRVARACRDLNAGVARQALRLVGEWKLSLARGAAEEVARDVNRPLTTRKEAVRTLALLGDQAATETLRSLSRNADELGGLATWSLACLGAPSIGKDAEARIYNKAGTASAIYYRALARLGPEGRTILRRCALPKQPFPTGRALELLESRKQSAIDAYAYLRDPNAADDLEAVIRSKASSRRLRDTASRERAAEALALRTDPRSQRKVAELMIRPARVHAETELLKGIYRHGVPQDLKDPLSRILRRLVLSERDRQKKNWAARALVRVDPLTARSVLSALIRGRIQDRRSHDLVHPLAWTGDTSLLLSEALPFAKRALKLQNEPGERLVWLALGGLDQFYAGRYDEARLAFLRLHWTIPHWSNDLPSYNLACVASAQDAPTSALRLLRRAARHGYKDPQLVRYDLDFVRLRNDPRFKNLLKQLDLAAETGRRAPSLPLP